LIAPLEILSMVLSRFEDKPVSKRTVFFENQLDLLPILLKILEILIAVQSQASRQTSSATIE
jgi:hypothetical protein